MSYLGTSSSHGSVTLSPPIKAHSFPVSKSELLVDEKHVRREKEQRTGSSPNQRRRYRPKEGSEDSRVGDIEELDEAGHSNTHGFRRLLRLGDTRGSSHGQSHAHHIRDMKIQHLATNQWQPGHIGGHLELHLRQSRRLEPESKIDAISDENDGDLQLTRVYTHCPEDELWCAQQQLRSGCDRVCECMACREILAKS